MFCGVSMLNTLFPFRREKFDALTDLWLTLSATFTGIQQPGWRGPHPHGAHKQFVARQSADTQRRAWEAEITHAQEIYSGLFPQSLPLVQGIEIYAESRAANCIGGDFYDFLAQDNDELTFAIGDVCNKGVSAALLMAVLHKVLHTSIKLIEHPTPNAILAYANADMYEEFNQAAMFATGFVGQYCSRTRRLRFANAGHAPVIYCPVGRPPEILRAENTPLGVLKQPTFIDREIHLGVGDRLIIATDGLIDLSNSKGSPIGQVRLMQLLAQVHHQPIDLLAKMLFAMANDHSQKQHVHDDQTLLILGGV